MEHQGACLMAAMEKLLLGQPKGSLGRFIVMASDLYRGLIYNSFPQFSFWSLID